MKFIKGIGAVTFITILAYILVLAVLAILYFIIQKSEYTITFIGGGILQTLPFIIIPWLIWVVHGRKKWSLGFIQKGWLKELTLGLFIGFVLISISILFILLSGNVAIEGFTFHKDFLYTTLTLFLLFVMVGFSEELFSRGLLQGTAKYYVGKWFAILFSAVAFSILHIGNESFAFGLPFINLCLAGVMFALFREWRKSIWLPVGLHITWNFFQGPIYGFPVSGINLPSIVTIETDLKNEHITGGTFGAEGSIIVTGLLLVICFYILGQLLTKK